MIHCHGFLRKMPDLQQLVGNRNQQILLGAGLSSWMELRQSFGPQLDGHVNFSDRLGRGKVTRVLWQLQMPKIMAQLRQATGKMSDWPWQHVWAFGVVPSGRSA